MRRIRDLQAARSREFLVGREREIERLVRFVEEAEPLVFHLHGMAGVGKSQVVEALLGRLGECSPELRVLRVDARGCEPSPPGFAQALGSDGAEFAKHPGRLAALVSEQSARTLLVIDGYECFGLLDSWLRQQFLPALGENVKTLLVGRNLPRTAWLAGAEWQGLFAALELEPLPEAEALRVATGRGLPDEVARSLVRQTQGHPLALVLGVGLITAGGRIQAPSGPLHQVLDRMARLFLDDVADSVTRRVVSAASLVRTVTAPLLEAMFPENPAEDSMLRLRDLPFVQPGPDGLVVHEAVKAALAPTLKAREPVLYQRLRQAAGEVLSNQYRTAARNELWRSTADVLYLIENELVREAFFPRNSISLTVETARPEDHAAIRGMVEQFDGAESVRALDLWWRYHAESFFVARDRQGEVAAFYQAIVANRVHREILVRDRLAALWASEISEAERPATLWVRRSLGREHGERPSAERAACWLDIKRLYLELRPTLRRVMGCHKGHNDTFEAMERLGFRLLSKTPTLDGVPYQTHLLDMGPESVDGWLSRVLSRELQSRLPSVDSLLDVDAHELVIDGERRGLTPLEFGVMSTLLNSAGKVVARHELIESVWGLGREAATSNVVETVVRSLRQKLGPYRKTLETVRGVGYRYRPLEEDTPM